LSDRAKGLSEELEAKVQHICKRTYRGLELSGYARIDLRLDEAGNPWVLEANPNPQIAYGDDFAESAEQAGISYKALLQRIMNLGMRWQPESVA
jgi:D-alanine-D-alanine ligase